jgi:hypothetical protein
MDVGEECDGADRPSCVELGYDYGTTSCANCNLNENNCHVDAGEVAGDEFSDEFGCFLPDDC